MNRTIGLFWLLSFLLLASSCSSPSERKPLEHSWKDGPQPICIAPPADVMVKGVTANAELAATKIFTLLKGTGGVSVDVERIRREVPAEVAAFEVIDYRLCLQYGNQLLSKEEYLSFTKQVVPAIKQQTPENPIAKVPDVAQSSLLATCHQSISGLKRQPKVFIPAWHSVLERLRNERNTYDLRNLFEIWGRIPVGLTGKDLIHEGTYTLTCLREEGQLKMEKIGVTSRYWGEDFENQTITFLSPWDPPEMILQSSPCQLAGVVSTAAQEFCVNVTELQLLNHDTQVEVSLSLVNRTGRRLFITLVGRSSLTDSSGKKWAGGGNKGLGIPNYPVSLEPDIATQGSISFFHNGQSPADLTFSLRGEIGVLKVDSRGEAVPGQIAVVRGFNLSGIRTSQRVAPLLKPPS